MQKATALLKMAKPRTILLLSVLTLTGAAYSPNFLSPSFPETVLVKLLDATPSIASLANAALAAVVVTLVWSATAMLNDCYDVEIDRVSNPSRAIVSGVLRREEVIKIAALLYVLALIIVFTLGDAISKAIVALAVVLGVQYSAPPLRLRRSGTAAMLVIGCGVALAFLGGALSQYRISGEALETAFLFGFFAFNAALLKDFKDVEGDRRAGVKTLPVILGHKRASRLALLGIALSYALLIIYTINSFAVFILLPISIINIYKVLKLHDKKESPDKVYTYTYACGICIVLILLFQTLIQSPKTFF
jgi:4-hydroxybenzoate polyprenyltransferase